MGSKDVLQAFTSSYIFLYGLLWHEIYDKETDSFAIEEVNQAYEDLKNQDLH